MSIRRLVVVAGLAAGSGMAVGQWSSNPAANLKVADGPNDQVQAKLVATPDGGCYVSWFDNSTGGYDVYLQRLDAAGVEQWPHNGVLIADRAVSSTVDYDLSIDGKGNAVVTYNDDGGVSGVTQQIAVQKVSPAGAKLWGAAGVTVSSGTDFKANPKVAVLADGGVVVGYSNSPSGAAQFWIMQKLDSTGAPQWAGSGVSVVEASRYMALSDLEPDGAGGVVGLWVRGSSASATTSSKALYAQRYDSAGGAQWNGGSPVIVFNTTSIQNGYFPTMIPDGSGGAVFGWYEIGGSRNAYIQHVLGDGSFKFASPVASTGATAGRIRIDAGLGYAGGEYFLASTESNASPQGTYTVIAQKFDSAGARQWTDAGTLVLPSSGTVQPSFVQVQPYQGGCMVFFMETRSAVTRVISGARVAADGSLAWSPSVIEVNNDSSTDKSRLASCMSTQGFAITAFGWGGFGAADLAAQNVNGNGTLGPAVPACYANCDQSTAPPILNVQDFSCFLNQFASGSSAANCDGSTAVPVLNVQDFACFLNAFAAGCS
jgi:hypothetical protein